MKDETVAGLALGSIPVAIAMMAKNAGAQAPTVNDILNFALTLEYLEDEFYKLGLAAAGLIPANHRRIFEIISAHESAHVAFLQAALGAAAIAKPTFDFSGGNGAGNGPFGNPFAVGNYATFQAMAQAFEDTGVRAYKGQAAALKGNKPVFTAALSIHSVEARHAAEVRRLRGNFSEAKPNKGWISQKENDIGAAGGAIRTSTDKVYAGEENTTHGGVNITTIATVNALGLDAMTESFDEPLTMAQVLDIVNPFIAGGP